MNIFKQVLIRHNLKIHDGRPLWKYFVTKHEFEQLQNSFNTINSNSLNPLDATLYYAEWWKRNYNGGLPSKERVFETLNNNIKSYYNSEDFYKEAVRGGEILRLKWIVKQNTLRFKTLLLQGGLPLNHIKNNHNNYAHFLLAVLEEQPETIEDFILKPEITSLLPASSRNDIVYENCFEIVQSFLNEENTYDDLFTDNLTDISRKLKSGAKNIKRKVRISRPKNYWLLNNINDKANIKLSIGLADKYTKESLKEILGLKKIESREVQLFIDDKPICVFKEMYSKEFKTEWYNYKPIIWDGSDISLAVYVIIDGKKQEISGFIPTMPSMETPTLWTQFIDSEWRLIKGTGSADKNAQILMPAEWSTDSNSKIISIWGNDMKWVEFEGEITVRKNEVYRRFLSNVKTFDWIILNDKPEWMIKANMPVIKNNLVIHVYDENNEKIKKNNYEVYVRPYDSDENWRKAADGEINIKGCIDLKIKVGKLVTYEQIYNIGNLDIRIEESTLEHATIIAENCDTKILKLYNTDILSIESNENVYNLNVDTTLFKIPTQIKSSLGLGCQKKLFFQMESPFRGLSLINEKGDILDEGCLTLNDLHGIRILGMRGIPTIMTMCNSLNDEVVISKNIENELQPLISYRDEIVKLFYLSDVMDFKNIVYVRLKSGNIEKKYEVSGFSHSLFIDDELLESNQVRLYKSNDDLDLFGIPLVDYDLTPVPLLKENDIYTIPNNHNCHQWIIISSKDKGNQLMPKFVNTDENYEYVNRDERIMNYAEQLKKENFDSQNWRNILELFSICSYNGYDIPFSTFDQFRALTIDSYIAAKTFLFLAINQIDQDTFLQKDIPEMEKDLGFCFHWISKNDWEYAYDEIFDFFKVQLEDRPKYIGILNKYFQECNLQELGVYILNNQVSNTSITNEKINEMRSHLGERVLEEIPRDSPRIGDYYNIPIDGHEYVSLLIKCPIAVGESITGNQVEYPIWGNKEVQKRIRRNIQYSQYLVPNFYKQTILHVLSH